MAPQSKKTKLPFTRWVEAWNIFVCIYVTGHSENAQLTPSLAQHFQVVCDHFHKGQDWEYYDSQFRLLREKGLVQWGEKHYDASFEAKDRGRPALPPQNKLVHIRQLCRKASVGPTITLGAANLKNVRSRINATTDFPMLHEIVAVEGSPFVGSQALAAECHKPEVIGHTLGREEQRTAQYSFPPSKTPSPFRRTKQLCQSAN